MNKDVIYIDVEDDITAIIGKIKASKEKIIALVPPKRVGVLQSAVNLRLLERMASNSNKRLVLITNNPALVALSAATAIPVAKNLQSKPELAEVSALSVDDGEDIIDGAGLPIGELEKTADIDENATTPRATPLTGKVGTSVSLSSIGAAAVRKTVKAKRGIKVPNFNTFRKKLFIGIAAGVLLIGFLVWAAVFAPGAKVIITARTTPAAVNTTATLGGTAATDVSKGVIQSIIQQTKKDVSVEFDATGQKDIGEKAGGSITIRNCDYDDGFTLQAGTQFTSSGKVYVSTSAVSVPGYTSPSSSLCSLSGSSSGKANVTAQATQSGESYNNSGSTYQISTIPAGSKVDAVGTSMIGGTTKIVKVVSADDVQKASEKLVEQSSDEVKLQLTKLFTGDQVVIDDSFTIDRATPVSAPAIDAEATGKAKLTSSTNYTLSGIAKTDIEVFLKANLEKQVSNTKDQRVYDNGKDKVKLSGFTKTGDVSTVKIVSTGQIGPKIDDAQIKEQVKGKIYGEVQSELEAIDGISSVDVQFSFFWVRTVPNNTDKIDVEFKIENE